MDSIFMAVIVTLTILIAFLLNHLRDLNNEVKAYREDRKRSLINSTIRRPHDRRQ